MSISVTFFLFFRYVRACVCPVCLGGPVCMCLCGKGNGYDVSHSGYYLICDKQCYKSRTHVAKVFSGTVVREGKLIQKTRQLLKTVPFNHEQMVGPFSAVCKKYLQDLQDNLAKTALCCGRTQRML